MSSRTEAAAARWGPATVATLAAAVVLRAIGLDDGLWYDEIVTLVDSARLPVVRIATHFTDVNTHPLYSILAHASMSLFGESAWALRLPAAVFGVASVAMVHRIGAAVLAREEAWVATAVIATSYHHVWFSQNARGYTLMGFLSLASTWTLLGVLGAARLRGYVVYAAALVAGVYTHLTMAFVAAGHAAVILGGRTFGWQTVGHGRLRTLLWSWTGAAVLSAAAYAPFMAGIVALMGRENTQQAAEVATASWAFGEAIRSILAGAGVPAALAGGACALVGFLSLARSQTLLVSLLVAPALVTGIVLVGAGQPLRPRFFFFLAGAAALFVGRGVGVLAAQISRWRALSAVAGRRLVLAAGVVLVLASLAALPANYRVPKQDFAGALALLEESERAGATIAMAGPACLPFERYYGKAWACLETAADLERLEMADRPARVVFTLGDYIADPVLRRRLRSACEPVRVFSATLGGGELTICQVALRGTAPEVG